MEKLVLILLFVFAACNSEPPSVKEETKPIVVTNYDDLYQIADGSACAKYAWKNRGVAPVGYMRGMVLMYAAQVCDPNKTVASQSVLGSKDVAGLYGLSPSQLSTFTILVGLGMRETSGQYCIGRDSTAPNVTGDTVEAGLFQASYNSNYFAKDELLKIYSLYKQGKRKCHLSTFRQGVNEDRSCTAKEARVWGSGEGATYQKLAKECPAFATEWAAVLVRNAYHHFGPLKRKEAEYLKSCESMLAQVEASVKANPSLCEQL